VTYLVGKVAIQVVAGAPNNGVGEDNLAKVKAMRVGRDIYPYVSAQAFRRWVRDSLPADEPRSKVIRSGSGKKQQAHTAGAPHRYLDDDLFGYMVAVKKNADGEAGTCQRDTVLATGTLVAVAPRRPEADFGTMSRGFAAGENPVLHSHEFYSADLAGDLMLDLPRVGTFETAGSGLKVALTSASADEARKQGAEEVELRSSPALRLPIEERRRRIAVLLRTLAAVQGGAKKSLHYGDRTPALILLAPMKGGVNPFTRVLDAPGGKTRFNTSVFQEEFDAWADELDGPVMIGWAPGFLGDQREAVRQELADLTAAGSVVIDHPRVVLNTLADNISNGSHDAWFEDAKS
jgi:CRISPR-associated protein Cas7/Cst2/DevR subtype I-B